MTSKQKQGVFRFWFFSVLMAGCIPLAFVTGGIWIAYYAALMIWFGINVRWGWRDWRA